jgi:hypothetical protein
VAKGPVLTEDERALILAFRAFREYVTERTAPDPLDADDVARPDVITLEVGNDASIRVCVDYVDGARSSVCAGDLEGAARRIRSATADAQHARAERIAAYEARTGRRLPGDPRRRPKPRTDAPWWLATANEHAAAERRCGRRWTSTSGCACSACSAARMAGWSPSV